MHLVEKMKFENGLVAEIHYDEDAPNPRENDNLGTMFCWHPQYALGDEQFLAPGGRGATIGDSRSRREALQFESLEEAEKYLTEERKALIVLPLYLYDHSGITIRVGPAHGFPDAMWDVTMVGFVYTTDERVTELCGHQDEFRDPEWLRKSLVQEVEVYDSYLRGDAYGFVIEDDDGNHYDSCWGFVGDLDGCKSEAKAEAEAYAKEEVEDRRRKERVASAQRLVDRYGMKVMDSEPTL